MWSNIGNSSIDMGEVIIKTSFFEEWSWFKFNDLGLALGIALKFYTSVAKGLKVKVKKFWGLNNRGKYGRGGLLGTLHPE